LVSPPLLETEGNLPWLPFLLQRGSNSRAAEEIMEPMVFATELSEGENSAPTGG